MKFIKLSNGFVIPIIGMGTYPQKEELEELVLAADQVGYSLFDTSDNYKNESFYGRGYRQIIDNEKTITITKFSNPFEDIDNIYENSIREIYNSNQKRNLIYLLHWPYPHMYLKLWELMEELYFEGKCDVIGVCNFEVKHLSRLLEKCRVKPMINQIECHPFFQQKEICKFCEQNSIQVMAYTPIGRMHSSLRENVLLNNLAVKYGKTIAQIILRWHIEQERIIIPSTRSKQRLKENINIFDFSLTKEEINEINKLDCGLRIRFDPNERFSNKEVMAMKNESLFMDYDKKKIKPYIIIYGAGVYGKQLYKFLKRIGSKVDFFCQTNEGGIREIYNIPIIDVNKLRNINGKKIILIAIKDKEISKGMKLSLENEDTIVYECRQLIKEIYF